MGGLVPALTQETLDNQREVVKNERRQRYDNVPYGDAWLRLLPLLAVSVAAATPYPTRLWNRLTGRRPALTVLEPVLLVAVLALSVACAVRSDYSPFLYFNF